MVVNITSLWQQRISLSWPSPQNHTTVLICAFHIFPRVGSLRAMS